MKNIYQGVLWLNARVLPSLRKVSTGIMSSTRGKPRLQPSVPRAARHESMPRTASKNPTIHVHPSLFLETSPTLLLGQTLVPKHPRQSDECAVHFAALPTIAT